MTMTGWAREGTERGNEQENWKKEMLLAEAESLQPRDTIFHFCLSLET